VLSLSLRTRGCSCISKELALSADRFYRACCTFFVCLEVFSNFNYLNYFKEVTLFVQNILIHLEREPRMREVYTWEGRTSGHACLRPSTYSSR